MTSCLKCLARWLTQWDTSVWEPGWFGRDDWCSGQQSDVIIHPLARCLEAGIRQKTSGDTYPESRFVNTCQVTLICEMGKEWRVGIKGDWCEGLEARPKSEPGQRSHLRSSNAFQTNHITPSWQWPMTSRAFASRSYESSWQQIGCLPDTWYVPSFKIPSKQSYLHFGTTPLVMFW